MTRTEPKDSARATLNIIIGITSLHKEMLFLSCSFRTYSPRISSCYSPRNIACALFPVNVFALSAGQHDLHRGDALTTKGESAIGLLWRSTGAARIYFFDNIALQLEYSYRHQDKSDVSTSVQSEQFATARFDFAF